LQEYKAHNVQSEQRTAIISKIKDKCKDLSFLQTLRKSLESVPEEIRMEIELELVRTSIPKANLNPPITLNKIGALKEIQTNINSNNSTTNINTIIASNNKVKTSDFGGKQSDKVLSSSEVEKLKLKSLNQDGSKLENKFKNYW